jgi:predicted helicase
VFKSYGRGVGSSRDDWMYSFQKEDLESNILHSAGDLGKKIFTTKE